MNEQQSRPKNRIRDWKGLLHDEARKDKMRVFVALLALSVSMTFTQFGFVGIGPEGSYLGYALGLLGPLAAIALLLGKGAGAPFDPVRREDPTKPSSIQETAIGGLGIFMVKRSMDDLAYMRDDDENVVVFKKGW